MKDTLEVHFGKYYGSTKKLKADYKIENGCFGIADAKACRDCEKYTPEFNLKCDKNVVFIDSRKTDVYVLALESFLEKYNGLKAIPSGKKCDLLVYSKSKVVFCDMTCCNSKYVGEFNTSSGEYKIGKRLTAFSQIEDTINVLCRVPEIAFEVNRRNSKIALFACREKVFDKLSHFDTNVVEKMKAFEAMQKKNADEKMLSDLRNGFVFKEVWYPEIYQW